MKILKPFVVLLTLMFIAGTATALASYITSADEYGNVKNLFYGGEDVYVRGSTFEPNDECVIYIVNNGNWEYVAGGGIPAGATGSYDVYVGDPIPMGEVVAGPIPVTMESDGSLANKVIWSPPTATGEFDIVVDCGEGDTWDGIHSMAGTPRDGIDLTFCIGLTVVPESVIAVGLIALLVPGMIYVARKKK